MQTTGESNSIKSSGARKRTYQSENNMIVPVDDGSREDIYRRAIQNYQEHFPQFDAVTSLARFLGKDEKTVYSYLSGRIVPSADVEEKIFGFCLYPKGFDEKKNLVFNSHHQESGR